MEQRLRRRLRIEAVLTGISVVLCLLTLAYPEWIEATTGLEPDAGSGALEWAIAAAFLLAALAFGMLARRDRRRLALGET